MSTGIEVASLFGVLSLDDKATGVLRGFNSQLDQSENRLKSLGQSLTNTGLALTKLAAPAVAVFGDGIRQAMKFEESIANIGAVLGKTIPEMGEMGQRIRDLGAASRYGPQEAAQAFYDIVGGVTDATQHMAIFEAAIHTAQAGNADLTATTAALISVMNSYGFSAEQAGYVSDTLTQIVAMGVGTMDEFAGALADVTGTAAQAGVSFTEAGAAVAFLTTKGFSAAEATTRIRQAIIALLNPNADMEAAFTAAGIASGSAALKNLGLAGTYRKINQALGGSLDKMQAATGSVWAMQGATAVATDTFTDFAAAFAETADGLTASAEAIQMSSHAAMWDVLQSKVENLRIELGNALLPALQGIVEKISPLVEAITNWIAANPELVQTIGTVVAVAGTLGVALTAVGFAISSIAVLLSPAGLMIAGLLALTAAFASNFGGIADIIKSFQNGWEAGLGTLEFYAQYYINKIVDLFRNQFAKPIGDLLAGIGTDKLVALTVGVGLLAATLVASNVIGLVSTLVTTVQGLGLAAALTEAIGLAPLALGILLIGGMLLAYATNFAGFKDWVDDLGNKMRTLVEQVQQFKLLLEWVLIHIGDVANLVGSGTINSQTGIADRMFGNGAPDKGGANKPAGNAADGWRKNAIGLYKDIGSVVGDGGTPIGRAHGGSVFAGQAYMVGERGREAFVPIADGVILPNNLLIDPSTFPGRGVLPGHGAAAERRLGQGGSFSVSGGIHIHAPNLRDLDDPRQLEELAENLLVVINQAASGSPA